MEENNSSNIKTFLFPNFDNNEWIVKYNQLILDIKSGKLDFKDKKLSLHHIIPRSIAPSLTNNEDNFVYLTGDFYGKGYLQFAACNS